MCENGFPDANVKFMHLIVIHERIDVEAKLGKTSGEGTLVFHVSTIHEIYPIPDPPVMQALRVARGGYLLLYSQHLCLAQRYVFERS